eukprot:s10495_g2.t1
MYFQSIKEGCLEALGTYKTKKNLANWATRSTNESHNRFWAKGGIPPYGAQSVCEAGLFEESAVCHSKEGSATSRQEPSRGFGLSPDFPEEHQFHLGLRSQKITGFDAVRIFQFQLLCERLAFASVTRWCRKRRRFRSSAKAPQPH